MKFLPACISLPTGAYMDLWIEWYMDLVICGSLYEYMDIWIRYLTCSSTGFSIIVTLVSCRAGVRPYGESPASSL